MACSEEMEREKTTTMKMLLGLTVSHVGTVHIFGENMPDTKPGGSSTDWQSDRISGILPKI